MGALIAVGVVIVALGLFVAGWLKTAARAARVEEQHRREGGAR